nr:F0F1 ATP synthase subunit delta [Anaerolineae bacterium]
MAELSTLARPYAKAVYEYAEAAGDLETWSQTLALLGALAENDSVRELLSSPAFTTVQQADTLIEVCGDE